MKYSIWKLRFGLGNVQTIASPVIGAIYDDFLSADKAVLELSSKEKDNVSFIIAAYTKHGKLNNRVVMDMGAGEFIVVHEGLQNVKSIRERMDILIERLISLRTSEAHLSDCAMCLSSVSKDLNKLSTEAFEAHNVEKAGFAF